ncbi:hypothetical protein E5288_WYG012847 [Bos mutus]|uniref:Enoyl reductase (ER) domain-containing protein n=1 Tax=Bos mutus TaxID=72004 RepID=A0A6B0QTH6_9CETA|nr:hypothetical protein [Bos mutus]
MTLQNDGYQGRFFQSQTLQTSMPVGLHVESDNTASSFLTGPGLKRGRPRKEKTKPHCERVSGPRKGLRPLDSPAHPPLLHKIKKHDHVHGHGASGRVGIAACQIARAYGLKVLGTASTEEGQKIVLENGAHKVFNHKEANYIDKIKKSVGEKGVDVIIEMLANVNLSNDLNLLSHGGRVIVVGSRGTIEINPRDTMTKESSIKGVTLFSSTKEEFQQFAAALQAGMEIGWLRPVIGPQYLLEKATQAHENIIHSSGATGKMILLLN